MELRRKQRGELESNISKEAKRREGGQKEKRGGLTVGPS